MFQNGQKVVVVSSGDPARVIKVQAASSLDTGRYPTVDTTGVTGRDQQVQIVSGGDETRFPKLQGLADARSTADSVISALTPAAWYRNATDVVSSGGFASIWADYASSDVGLVLPGVASNNASVPDAAYWPTGSFELIFRASMADWTPASGNYVVAHGTGGANLSFGLYVNPTTGQLILLYSVDGSAALYAASTVAPTISDGEFLWCRMTRNTATGAVEYFTAADSASIPASWTQLGTTVAGTAGALFNTTEALKIGTRGDGANAFNGTIRRVIVKDGIDGTPVFDADFSSQAIGAASFTESSSNAATVTINASGAAPAHIGKARDLLQGTGTNQPAYAAGVFTADGADNYMRASFTLNNGCTIVLVGSQVSWASTDYLVGAVSANVALFQLSATPKFAIYAGTGNIPATGTTNLAVGTRGIIVAVYNGASSSLRVNNNAKDSGNAGASNLGGITLFASHVPGGYANATAEEMIVFPSALSDANQDAVITALNNALTVF